MISHQLTVYWVHKQQPIKWCYFLQQSSSLNTIPTLISTPDACCLYRHTIKLLQHRWWSLATVYVSYRNTIFYACLCHTAGQMYWHSFLRPDSALGQDLRLVHTYDASISASTRKRTCEPGRRKHKRKRKKKERFPSSCACAYPCVVASYVWTGTTQA